MIWILTELLKDLSDYGVNSEEEVFPTLIGTEFEKTGKLTKDKILMKKNKRKSQKWIMLKNI